MTEETNISTEELKESKPENESEEKKKTKQIDSLLPDKVNDIELANLETKRTELAEIEKRVDEKTDQLKKIVSQTETFGKGFAGVKEEKLTDEQIADKVMKGELDPFKADGY